jgi:hypothetical protein
MKESKDFMSILHGMFNCVFGVLEFWRETIISSMFEREHLHCCGNSGKKMGF